MDIAQAGARLSAEQTAQLALALRETDGRRAAWSATSAEMWQHDLWLDMTRRVPDEYVTTPANLLAWNSWRRGNTALAWAALSRAYTATPDNPLSILIATVLTSPVNPATLPWPLPANVDPSVLLTLLTPAAPDPGTPGPQLPTPQPGQS